MSIRIRNLAATAAVAAMVAASVPATAHATHQWGHFAAGVGLGLLLAPKQPYYAPPPAYAPAPVYVQPRVCYRKEKFYDPYTGWGWRSVQYYC